MSNWYQYLIAFVGVIVLFSTLLTFYRFSKYKSLKNIIKSDFISILIGILAVLMTIFISILGKDGKEESKVSDIKYLTNHLNNYEDRISNIEKRIELFNDSLFTITAFDTSQILLNQIKKRIDNNTKSIAKFEGLILSDAEYLITLPLLKQEISNIKTNINDLKNQINSQNNMFEETQNQNRWILGTLGLGILAIIVPIVRSTFMSQKNRENE